MQNENKKWEWEIGPKPDYSFSVFRSIYAYRHFHSGLVRKEFLLNYQQTILGPLWIFFQPLLTLCVYVLVFGVLIGIPTGKKLPPVLFYFSGIILWNLFNDTFWGISNTFRDHIHLYSKVYFPRIIVPLSILSTQFLRFLIQFLMFVIVWIYFIVFRNFHFEPGILFLALPLVFVSMAMVSTGFGLMAALLTARYRDFANLIGIILRLLMFVTPVLYPLASIPDDLKWIVLINPLSSLFELFRLCILGEGTVSTFSLFYSFSFGLITLVISFFLFSARSNKLIDIS